MRCPFRKLPKKSGLRITEKQKYRMDDLETSGYEAQGIANSNDLSENGVEDKYFRKYNALLRRCCSIQKENEVLVNRLYQVRKLIRRLRRERKLLTKELDKHGDNFRSLPLTIAIEEDIKPQVSTQAASLPALGRPRTSNSTSSSKRQAKRERPDHDSNTTTSTTIATTTTATTSSSPGMSNPKRSTGAFLQFCLDQREATQTQFQQQHGQQLDKKGLTKLLSIRWNKLSDDEKKIYIEKYEIAREEMNIKQEQ